MSPTYLEHHGILGQKWGVRRYQNPDGTLTEAGKKRLEKLSSKYNESVNKFQTAISEKRRFNTSSKIEGSVMAFHKYGKKIERKFGKETVEDLEKRVDPIVSKTLKAMYKAYWGNTKDLKSLQKEFSDRQKSNVNNAISDAQRSAFLANQQHQRFVQQENERINQLNIQTQMMNMDNFMQQNMINNMMIQQQTLHMQMNHFM